MTRHRWAAVVAPYVLVTIVAAGIVRLVVVRVNAADSKNRDKLCAVVVTLTEPVPSVAAPDAATRARIKARNDQLAAERRTALSALHRAEDC